MLVSCPEGCRGPFANTIPLDRKPIFHVEPKGAIGFDINQMILDLFCVCGFAIWSESHDFIFARVHFEPRVVGERRVQEAEGMRKGDFPQWRDGMLVSCPEGCRGPFANTIHAENRSVFVWGRIKSRGRM